MSEFGEVSVCGRSRTWVERLRFGRAANAERRKKGRKQPNFSKGAHRTTSLTDSTGDPRVDQIPSRLPWDAPDSCAQNSTIIVGNSAFADFLRPEFLFEDSAGSQVLTVSHKATLHRMMSRSVQITDLEDRLAQAVSLSSHLKQERPILAHDGNDSLSHFDPDMQPPVLVLDRHESLTLDDPLRALVVR